MAEAIASALGDDIRGAFEVSVAGPGFINFAARPALLLGWLQAHRSRDDLARGASAAHAGETWVVDYSSPNTAKQMHVGHLRSAVIGEAIARLLGFTGARVVRDNHIGDWGTQYGKLIWACKRHLDEAALARDAIDEFERLYKIGNAAAEADAAVMEAARAELLNSRRATRKTSRSGGASTRRASRRSSGSTSGSGIRFDETLGESFYNDKVDRVYAELSAAGISSQSEGAQVVFHPEHPRFKTQPMIVRKSDGAANYATTDLATILYRSEHFGASAILYVVDKRQGDHFEQLFLTARKWFGKRERPRAQARARRFRDRARRGRQAPQDARGRPRQAKGPPRRGRATGVRARDRQEPGVLPRRAPDDRRDRGRRLRAIRRPFAEPLERLRLFLGQDDLP